MSGPPARVALGVRRPPPVGVRAGPPSDVSSAGGRPVSSRAVRRLNGFGTFGPGVLVSGVSRPVPSGVRSRHRGPSDLPRVGGGPRLPVANPGPGRQSPVRVTTTSRSHTGLHTDGGYGRGSKGTTVTLTGSRVARHTTLWSHGLGPPVVDRDYGLTPRVGSVSSTIRPVSCQVPMVHPSPSALTPGV